MASSVIGRLSAILELNTSQFSAGVDRAQKKMSGFRKSMNNMGRNLALPLTIAGGAMIKAASDIEKGMIGVQKTTGLADSEIKKLQDSILEFASKNNVTIDSLLETAKVAGQMGLQGQEAINQFTQAFAKLEQASDRTVQGEFGAQQFAKFLDLSGEGIAAAESLASSLVQLGNTSKTTEGKILSTAEEVVKKTNRFSIGGANILGLATALDEAGVKAEVAGSSMQKFFEGINTAVVSGESGLAQFVELTGRSREELRGLLETNPSQILLDFAEGLRQANASGANTAEMLNAMGLGGIRTSSTMNVLAERVEKLREKILSANDAQQKNVALQNEADAANRGAAAALQRLSNSLQKLARSRFFEQILNGLTKVVEGLTKLAQVLGETVMPAVTLFVTDSIELFMNMKESVVGFVTDMIEGVQRAIVQPLRDLGGKIQEWTEGVTGFFGDMYESVVGGSFVPDMVMGVKDWFERFPEVMVDPAWTATDSVSTAFETMSRTISSILKDVLLNAKSFGGALEDIFTNIGLRIADKLIDSFADSIAGSILGSGGSSGGIIAGAVKAIGLDKIGGAVGGLFGGGAVEAGTGAVASPFAGLGSFSAAAGPAAAFAGMFAAFKALSGGPGPLAIAAQNFAGGSASGGALGLRLTQAQGSMFGAGPNAGFAASFAQDQGLDARRPSDIGKRAERLGIASFGGAGLEQVTKVLEEAQEAFEELKKLGSSTFKSMGVDATEMGQILKDGVVDRMELARLGLENIGAKTVDAREGFVTLGNVSATQFQRIMQAVDQGRIRLEALRGETMFNQTEIQLLGEFGLTASELIAQGFGRASEVSRESLRRLRAEGVSGFRDIEGAARAAADAAASVGSGGVDFSPEGDPNADRDNNLTQQLRNDAQTRRIHGGGGL